MLLIRAKHISATKVGMTRARILQSAKRAMVPLISEMTLALWKTAMWVPSSRTILFGSTMKKKASKMDMHMITMNTTYTALDTPVDCVSWTLIPNAMSEPTVPPKEVKTHCQVMNLALVNYDF